MRTPLNSPLEVSVRVLMLLAESFPEQLDLNRLVLLDHGLLHSSDINGPASLHPALPIRAGELGMKRQVIDKSLEILARAELVEVTATPAGIQFSASESADSFVRLLTSDYAQALKERARWISGELEGLDEPALRERMRDILEHRSEEFEQLDSGFGTIP